LKYREEKEEKFIDEYGRMRHIKTEAKFYIDDKLCLSCIKYPAIPEGSFIWSILYNEYGRNESHWIPKKDKKHTVL